MAYADLLADVEDTLDRDDVDARLPRWLRLVEARLNRLLDDPEMEVISEATATGDHTTLPSDFGEMISVSTGDGPLRPVGPAEFASFDTSLFGTPRYYVVQDGGISLYPGNASANIRMLYRQHLPALTETNPSNWLLERAPDIYLYGVLLQANAWSVDNEAAAGWKALWDEAIAELRSDGARRKWGAGVIAPRIRRA
jgi:hypothetical protein